MHAPDPTPPESHVKIHILLADDHQILRAALAALFDDLPDIEIVGEAQNGEEAVDLAERLKPDVIVMDVSMPRMGGIEATAQISHKLPGTRIIGLSMHDEDQVARAMLDAGAEKYFPKGCPPDLLIDAIRHSSRGQI